MLNLLNMDNLHFVFIFFISLSSARLSLFFISLFLSFFIFFFILRAFHTVSVDFLLAGIHRETHTVTYMHVYIYMYIYMYNIKKRRDDIEYVHTGGSNGVT